MKTNQALLQKLHFYILIHLLKIVSDIQTRPKVNYNVKALMPDPHAIFLDIIHIVSKHNTFILSKPNSHTQFPVSKHQLEK